MSTSYVRSLDGSSEHYPWGALRLATAQPEARRSPEPGGALRAPVGWVSFWVFTNSAAAAKRPRKLGGPPDTLLELSWC